MGISIYPGMFGVQVLCFLVKLEWHTADDDDVNDHDPYEGLPVGYPDDFDDYRDEDDEDF